MLYRKMLRDFSQNKTQFLSIFLMLFAGIFIFAGMSAEGGGMSHSSQKYYKETKLSDAVIYGMGSTNDDLEELKKEPGIEDAELRLKMDALLSSDEDKTVSLNIVSKGNISQVKVIEGEKFTADKEGVWLDQKFARANNLKTGSRLKVKIEGQEFEAGIKGLVMQPEYIYAIQDDSQLFPDHENYGYAFLQGAYFKDEFLNGMAVPYNQILVRGDVSQKKLENLAEDVLDIKNAAVVMKKDYPGQSMFAEEIEQQKAMQYVFPMAFLAIALLTMVTTMTRLTANQRVLIGTMKAVGIRDGKIYRHYICYGALLGVLGSIAGILFGSKALPALVYHFQQEFYTMPDWEAYMGWQVYLAAGICILACALSGYFVCRRELREVPAVLLRPPVPAGVRGNRFESSRWWRRSSFKTQWNIRDVCRNKVRSFITVFGVAGCAMLTVCALGLRDTTDDMTDWMYQDLFQYKTKVILKDVDQTSDYRKNIDEKDVQFIMDSSVQIMNKGKKESYPLEVLEEGKGVQFMDTGRKETQLSRSGLALTKKAADKLNVKKGDIITWKPYGSEEWSSGKIVKIIRQPMAQGMYLRKEAYEEAGYTMIPTGFLSSQEKSQFDRERYQSVQSKKEAQEAMDNSLEVMNMMTAILIAAAVFLGVVVLYNLGVLSFTEKIRELATLEVLGFPDSKIRGILAIQNIWLTAAGIILGTPAGWLLLSYMLLFMGDNLDMDTVVSPVSYIVSIGGIFLLSCLVNLVLGRNVKKIDMVSALKGVE